MTDAHDQHRLHRALGQVAVDLVDKRAAQEREHAALAPGDMIQSVQVVAGGDATRTPAFWDFEVHWPDPFLNDVARGDMDSDLKNPSFAPGLELLSDEPVFAQVQLRRWLRDDSSLIDGAQLRLVVFAPGVTQPAVWSAVLHLNFIGYGVPADDDDDDDQENDF